jgi:hypothetical protein
VSPRWTQASSAFDLGHYRDVAAGLPALLPNAIATSNIEHSSGYTAAANALLAQNYIEAFKLTCTRAPAPSRFPCTAAMAALAWTAMTKSGIDSAVDRWAVWHQYRGAGVL